MAKFVKMSQIDEMYSLYLCGWKVKDINNQFSTDCEYHFKKNGLLLNTEERKINLSLQNTSIFYKFDKISNEIEAYIIGLYFGDGSFSQSQLKLTLHHADLNIIEKIRDYIKPDQPIINIGNSFKLVISNIGLVHNAKKLGLISNRKQNNILLPKVKKELFPHLLRGYFDADGSVFKDKTYLKCNICSISTHFLEDIKKKLTYFDIESVINVEKRVGKVLKIPTGETIGNYNMGRLFIRDKSSLQNFYNILYNNATIYMLRKKEKFTNYVNTELT